VKEVGFEVEVNERGVMNDESGDSTDEDVIAAGKRQSEITRTILKSGKRRPGNARGRVLRNASKITLTSPQEALTRGLADHFSNIFSPAIVNYDVRP